MAGTATRRTLTRRIHISLEDEGPELASPQAKVIVLDQVRSGLFGSVNTYDTIEIESAVWEEQHQHWHLVVALKATVLVDE